MSASLHHTAEDGLRQGPQTSLRLIHIITNTASFFNRLSSFCQIFFVRSQRETGCRSPSTAVANRIFESNSFPILVYFRKFKSIVFSHESIFLFIFGIFFENVFYLFTICYCNVHISYVIMGAQRKASRMNGRDVEVRYTDPTDCMERKVYHDKRKHDLHH